MSGIRPCSGGPPVLSTGAPPGFRPSVRPSSLPPPPAPLPRTKISNREPLRLEIHATQTKQTTDHHSNRENNALFSDRVRAVNRLCDCGAVNSARRNIDRPARRFKLIISNREPLRLEIHATHTKQTTDHSSNRENIECFSSHHQSTPYPIPKISNREPLRLETRLTNRKQTTDHSSNREKYAVFQREKRRKSIPFAPQASNLQPQTSNLRPSAPSFLFRVETTSTDCFLKLTDNSTYTHVSGRNAVRRIKLESPKTRKSAGRRKKNHHAPPIFVSIKNNPHRLFS